MKLPRWLEKRRHDLDICFDFMMVAALVGFAAVWAVEEYLISPPYVSEEKFPVRGIDVSSHNGDMNLEDAARDGIEFIFIKASEGADFRDKNFTINYKKAREAGLKIGAYHFFRFETDGVSQAINLLRAIGQRHLDLGIAVDVESHGNTMDVPPDSITDRLTAMVDFLNLCGHRVMFYSNRQGYYDYLSSTFEGYPLWICGFTETPIQTEWTFWQYDHHGRVNGIKGDVDLNAFAGSRQDWEDYLRLH